MFISAFLDSIRVGTSRQKTFGRALAGLSVMIGLMATGEMAQAANVLSNPGFETGGLGGWTTYGPNNYVQSTGGYAHGGTYYYKVYGRFPNPVAYNYTSIYQDNFTAPGAIYSANGWGYSLSSDAISGEDQAWIEVSFRDSSYNTLALYRSPVVTSTNITSLGGLSTWFNLQVTNQCSYTNANALILFPGIVTNTVTSLVAPAGAVFARCEIIFVQGPDNAGGSMYFDDLTLNQTGGTVVVPLQWNIVWSDEFNGTNINMNNWTFELGNNGGWGNQELEYYTGRTNNAYVDGNGLLHIVAQQESTNTYSFTSARMKTEGLYSTPTYGHFQWRAKLPTGFGMWPALWMLGADYPSVGWPACGEIDVVENPGNDPTNNQSSLHYGTSGEVSLTGDYFFGGNSITNFHIYELDWSPSSEQFLVDGHLYETQTVGSPFNAPFYFIMNLAVGGNYPGTTNASAIIASNTWPKEMLVDYVRVYELTAPLALSVAPQQNGSTVLSWPTNIVCHVQVLTNVLTGTNWFDTSVTTSPFMVSPDPNNNCVFYRLASP